MGIAFPGHRRTCKKRKDCQFSLEEINCEYASFGTCLGLGFSWLRIVLGRRKEEKIRVFRAEGVLIYICNLRGENEEIMYIC
jgi:hypothetical protein